MAVIRSLESMDSREDTVPFQSQCLDSLGDQNFGRMEESLEGWEEAVMEAAYLGDPEDDQGNGRRLQGDGGNGTGGCPCLADPPIDAFVIAAGEVGEGLLAARPNGVDVIPYPTTYGSLCGNHDAATTPYCADETGAPLADAADWCGIQLVLGGPGQLRLSALTPAATSTSMASMLSCTTPTTPATPRTPSPTASLTRRPATRSTRRSIAEHCSGGIQEDPRCPCINWADEPATRAQFENADGTALIVPLGDPAVDYEYALGYGSGACAAHDATHAPYCADATALRSLMLRTGASRAGAGSTRTTAIWPLRMALPSGLSRAATSTATARRRPGSTPTRPASTTTPSPTPSWTRRRATTSTLRSSAITA